MNAELKINIYYTIGDEDDVFIDIFTVTSTSFDPWEEDGDIETISVLRHGKEKEEEASIAHFLSRYAEQESLFDDQPHVLSALTKAERKIQQNFTTDCVEQRAANQEEYMMRQFDNRMDALEDE